MTEKLMQDMKLQSLKAEGSSQSSNVTVQRLETQINGYRNEIELL